MKIYHGTVLTVNKNDDVKRYLVEDGGKIRFVGDALPAQYRGAELVELGSRALIPSFADTHQHLASFSAFHAGLNVMEAASNAEILSGKPYAPQSQSVASVISKGIRLHSFRL